MIDVILYSVLNTLVACLVIGGIALLIWKIIIDRRTKKVIELINSDAWNNEGTNNPVVDLYVSIGRKCEWGKYIDLLNEEEKIVFFLMYMDGEVNNGGYEQYFLEGHAKYAQDTQNALKTIGADKLALITQRAIKAYEEKDYDLLCKLSDEYYEQEYPRHPDVLYELLYKYVTDNKEKFIRE